MDMTTEKECSALGGLFQLIINDLKGTSPVWEDFIGKAAKLHSQLKATISASSSFLDAFQKVADMATNTRGATKEIGKALTRLCLRHRSVEAKLKVFASTFLEQLVLPLQERLDEWRKITSQLDKDHAKEFKRVKMEIKKKSMDSQRLQKKVRKTSRANIQHSLDSALQDVSDTYLLLEESEKQSVRKVLIEERARYCYFVSFLSPVVDSELAMIQEIAHLKEIVEALGEQTQEPFSLPLASEQVISDLKGTDTSWAFQSPPSSPPSLGSRKSSMCSISSLNSSSSGSANSPSHHQIQAPPAGVLRVPSISSQDSGFTSQDHLYTCLATPPPATDPATLVQIQPGLADYTTGTTTATWPNLQDTLQFERAAASIMKSQQRPHTISTAYERSGHPRPQLTPHTFQPLPPGLTSSDSADTLTSSSSTSSSSSSTSFDKSPDVFNAATRAFHPPLPPHRQVPKELPQLPEKPVFVQMEDSKPPAGLPSSYPQPQPIYANISVSNFAGSESNYSDKVP